MLRSNSKKALENIRQYVLENYNPDYLGKNADDFTAAARVIWEAFTDEFVKYDRRRLPISELFAEWASGLPSVLDTCYYYNRSAVDDLGAILEETEEEKVRFSEADAENMLTRLIFREVSKAAQK